MDGFGFRDSVSHLLASIRFLSRLPVPIPDHHPTSLAVSLRYAPIAGLVIALGPAAVLLVATYVGLPSLVAAVLATIGLLAVTGALHEDGLADLADGFGGATIQRKLDIMRDSRVGTYGSLALIASLLLRIAVLQGIAERSGLSAAAMALLAAAVLSRAMMLMPLALLPAARPDGLAQAAGTPDQRTLSIALGLALPIAGLIGCGVTPNGLGLVASLLLSLAAALAMTRLARRQLGGVTGDVVGATQQVSELTFLVALCAGAQPL